MRMKRKVYKHGLELYPFDVWVVFEREHALEIAESHHNTYAIKCLNDPLTHSLSNLSKKETTLLIYIGEPKQNLEGIFNTVCHECFHAVSFICKRLDLPYTYKKDEGNATLCGHIGGLVGKSLEEYKKR